MSLPFAPGRVTAHADHQNLGGGLRQRPLGPSPGRVERSRGPADFHRGFIVVSSDS